MVSADRHFLLFSGFLYGMRFCTVSIIVDWISFHNSSGCLSACQEVRICSSLQLRMKQETWRHLITFFWSILFDVSEFHLDGGYKQLVVRTAVSTRKCFDGKDRTFPALTAKVVVYCKGCTAFDCDAVHWGCPGWQMAFQLHEPCIWDAEMVFMTELDPMITSIVPVTQSKLAYDVHLFLTADLRVEVTHDINYILFWHLFQCFLDFAIKVFDFIFCSICPWSTEHM